MTFVYSPSQINDSKLCKRKWGFSKIDKIPSVQHASAELGEKVHNQLERHLKGQGIDHAGDPTAAALAELAVPFLPFPNQPGLDVEKKWNYQLSNRSHNWTGRIDFLLFDRGALRIGDHKTTSSIGSWALSEEKLKIDVQANVYAQWAFQVIPGLAKVELQWTYIQTKGRRVAEPRIVEVDRAEVAENFELIDQEAEQLTLMRSQVKSAIELPYNPDACEMYGGCSYRHLCNLSPLDRMRSVMSNGANQSGDNLLAKLRAGVNPQQALQGAQGQVTQALPLIGQAPLALPAAPQAQVTNEIPKVQSIAGPNGQACAPNTFRRDQRGHITHSYFGRQLPQMVIDTQMIPNPNQMNSFRHIEIKYTDGQSEVPHEVAEWMEDLAAKSEASRAASAPPPTPQAWVPQGMPLPPSAPTLPQPVAPQFAPAMVQAPPMQVMQAPAQTGPINPPEWQQPPTIEQAKATPTTGMQAPAPMALPAAPQVESEKPKRSPGRPKKNPELAATPGAPTANTNQTQIGILYIGCFPIDDDSCIHLSTIVREANERIFKDHQLSDYSLAEFGKGPGILSVYVEDIIKAKYPGMDVIMDISSRESTVLLSRLWSIAGSVVRAL